MMLERIHARHCRLALSFGTYPISQSGISRATTIGRLVLLAVSWFSQRFPRVLRVVHRAGCPCWFARNRVGQIAGQ